jgi:hypothetical protein
MAENPPTESEQKLINQVIEAHETIKVLTELVRLQNVSCSWMLTSMTHEKDEGMYSDEIKAAIAVKAIADTI